MKIDSKHLNWGALSAVVALVAVAVYDNVAPMPQPEAPKKTVAELEAEKEHAKARVDESRTRVRQLTWQVSQDEVGPTAMAWVSEVARRNAVEIKAFRPQRSVDEEGLVQLNYLVTAEGPFLSVMRLIKGFEAEDSLLAVRAVQMASLDGASDTVRATIALVAYKEAAERG